MNFMSNSLNESVIKKIHMTKLFYELASDCFRIIENIERVGAGIILLQDSVELFLIAMCEQLKVGSTVNINFPMYFEKIKKKVPDKIIPFENDMLKLNKLRVSVKHYGVKPYIDDCKTLHNNVYSFFKEISESHLQIDFDSISLINLLNEGKLKKIMKQAEVDLKENNYRECQIGCRKALYLVFEKQFDIRSFEKYEEDIQNKNELAKALSRPQSRAPKYAKSKQYIKEKVYQPTDFIVIDYNEIWRNLLSNGIDLVGFSNVMLLTPEVYLFEEEGDWAIKEDVRGIIYNQENAEYCFRKTIEILLIKKRNFEREKRFLVRELKSITIKNKIISILEKASLKANVTYKMEKDLPYELRIIDEVRGLDSKNKYYYILGSKEKDKDKSKLVFFHGYILKNDIK
jgi:uncharacterized protein YjaG (DUF416 family)